MVVGERVILNALGWPDDYTGTIVGLETLDSLACIVRLDRQKPLVRGVRYYTQKPEGEILARYWQYCYPTT